MSEDYGERPTDEEIDKFIDQAKKKASKAVLHALMETIKHKAGPADDQKVKSLIRKISKRKPYDQCEAIIIEFNEIKQKLHMSLTLTPADYDHAVDLPHESYTGQICTWRAYLVKIAHHYWKSFAMMFPEVVASVKEFLPEWDGGLTIAPNQLSLYFVEDAPLRVGVFCRYFDDTTNTTYWKGQKK